MTIKQIERLISLLLENISRDARTSLKTRHATLVYIREDVDIHINELVIRLAEAEKDKEESK